MRSGLTISGGVLAIALATGATVVTTTPVSSSPATTPPSGHIVVLEEAVRPRAVAAAHADRYGFQVGHVYSAALRGYSATLSPHAAEAVASLPGVAWVQEDTEVHSTDQTTPTGVDRVDADLSPTADIDGSDQRVDVDVAVIDTGVDLDHPDLNVHRAGAENCSALSLSADDDHGHGSHVAGTIGAVDNAGGVVGVAPGARIWPVKVLNALGSGLNSDVVCGIDYVAAHADEIEVANMSLGGSGEDDGDCGRSDGDAMHTAICSAVDAGVTFVVAAGNDSEDAAGSAPAAYDEVITVRALADFDGKSGGDGDPTCRTDEDDTFASFSNHGADVDVIAPGVCIRSTWMMGGYNTISGTSMAAPHVTGGAALHAATHAAATPDQIRTALLAPGTTDWDASDDPDNAQEVLLDVSSY